MIQIFQQNINEISSLRKQLLHISHNFSVYSILDSNNWKFDKYKNYDFLAAFGAAKIIQANDELNSFESIREEHQINPEWLFGYFSYEVKNELEDLKSYNFDGVNAPKMQFFVPQLLILVKNNILSILIHEDYQKDKTVKKSIKQLFISETKSPKDSPSISIQHRITKEEYIGSINKIRQHIKHGDVYELNFCQEFYAENIEIEASDVYQKLVDKSPTPFSAFLRFEDIYIISASPERFLNKIGNKIISQPIKGTARRHSEKNNDNKEVTDLKNNQKERAENIMIVDLVRNDLAHTSKKNSVIVEELCEIYSFKQVHQMISTISSELNEKYDFIDVLKSTFPMGSMTGAPKIRAMQLIEKYEVTKRGIYSGAIGYITPEGDFDFNVVIRSLIYNKADKYLSFIAGGAITYQSDPEKEYAESLLKAEAIRDVLS